MPEMFRARTIFEAWALGVDHLFANGTDLNLLLVIAEPGAEDPHWPETVERVDAFLRGEGEHPLHTVAETIFPAWQYSHRGLRGLFATYAQEEYPALIADDPTRWGTYAHRLLQRQRADGTFMNPLEKLIGKLRQEAATPGPKRACYEIGVAEGAYDLPLYNTTDDSHRHLGGPCLSHLSFKLYDNAIHLSAFYRSHDYRFKTLGNLLGLARLQACVAHEVDRPMGSLVIHSSYAWMSAGGGKTSFKRLIADLRDMRGG